MIGLVAIDITIKMEMSDKEEEVFTRVTQVKPLATKNISKELGTLAMIADITSRCLKNFLSKLSSDNLDTAEEKRTACEIQ